MIVTVKEKIGHILVTLTRWLQFTVTIISI